MRLTKTLLSAVASALCSSVADAAVGDLNTAFGTNGIATPASLYSGSIIFVTSDGKLVYGGEDGGVYRLLANGSPDTSFATSGTYPQGTTYGYGGTSQLALFADGSFDEYGNGTNHQRSLSAHGPSGALITSFGSGGMVEASTTGQPPGAAPIPQDPQSAIQAGTGRLVTIAPADNFHGGPVQIAGFNAGGFDPSFPAGDLDVGQKVVLVSGIVPVMDGSFFLYGTAALNVSTGTSALAAAAFVAKLNAQGQLDTSFGNRGTLTFPDEFAQSCNEATTNSFVLAVTPQPGGRFDVLYQDLSPSPQACSTEKDHVFQYLANGTLDSTFGTKGDLYLGDGHSAQGMVLEADQKLLLSVVTPTSVELLRYTTAGILDTSFGTGGIVSEPSSTPAKLVLQTGSGQVLMEGADIHGNPTLAEIQVPVVDVTPSSFSFAAITGAAPGSQQTSNTITVAGLGAGASVPARVEGGLLSINDAPFVASGWVKNGDTLKVQGAAPAAAGAAASYEVTVGGVLANPSSPPLVSGSPVQANFQISTSPGATPGATAQLTASPEIVTQGGSITLQWSSTDATACTASGAWSGGQATSGSKAVVASTSGVVTFGLSCAGSGGTGTTSASVDVQPGSGSSSGGASSSSSSSSGSGSGGGSSSSSSGGGGSSGGSSSSSGPTGGSSSSGGLSGSQGGGGGGAMDLTALFGMLVAVMRRRVRRSPR